MRATTSGRSSQRQAPTHQSEPQPPVPSVHDLVEERVRQLELLAALMQEMEAAARTPHDKPFPSASPPSAQLPPSAPTLEALNERLHAVEDQLRDILTTIKGDRAQASDTPEWEGLVGRVHACEMELVALRTLVGGMEEARALADAQYRRRSSLLLAAMGVLTALCAVASLVMGPVLGR